jgi:hypothetical protein
MFNMTLEEKEKLISTWPEPWPELLSTSQKLRDERLKHAEDDEIQPIKDEYEKRIQRMTLK